MDPFPTIEDKEASVVCTLCWLEQTLYDVNKVELLVMWSEAFESIIQDGLVVKKDTLKAEACVPEWAKDDVDVADVEGSKLATKRWKALTWSLVKVVLSGEGARVEIGSIIDKVIECALDLVYVQKHLRHQWNLHAGIDYVILVEDGHDDPNRSLSCVENVQMLTL